MEEEKNNEIKEEHPEVTESATEETASEQESSQGSDLQTIKDAYEARLAKAKEEAESAKKKYEADLAEREKMIADLISSDGSRAPVASAFKSIIDRREKNKRY